MGSGSKIALQTHTPGYVRMKDNWQVHTTYYNTMMRTWNLVLLISVCFCYGEVIGVKNMKLKYRDCDDVWQSSSNRQSGIYTVFLNSSEPFEKVGLSAVLEQLKKKNVGLIVKMCVYCDFEAGDVRTPVMQQKYGRETFRREWHEYEYGFGDPARGDFWTGLRRIKGLADAGYNVLTVTLQDCNNVIKTIRYNHFRLGEAYQRYPLYVGGYVSGSVLPDDLSFNNGMPFATIDRPDHHNCANHQGGGWWYNYCTYTLPTGRYYIGCYYTPPHGTFYDGIYYKDWRGFGYSLKYFKMELSRY